MHEMTDERGWLIEQSRDLTLEITAAVPLLTSSNEEVLRHTAAAALVRGADLLGSALALLDEEKPAAVGIVARGVWEAWLVGTFLLHGGLHSYLWMSSEQIRQERVLTARNGVDGAEKVLDERQRAVDDLERARRFQQNEETDAKEDISWSRLTIEEMARAVGPLLEAAKNEPANVSAAYDLFYRSHSAFDTHGLRALECYITEQAGRFELSSPDPWLETHHAVAIAALYLSMLAYDVLEEFGLPTDAIEHLQSALQQRMEPAAGVSEDELPQLLRRAANDDE